MVQPFEAKDGMEMYVCTIMSWRATPKDWCAIFKFKARRSYIYNPDMSSSIFLLYRSFCIHTLFDGTSL